MGQIKNLTIILVILLSSMAYIGIAFANTGQEPIGIEIQIAPATLNLNLDRPSVTVHTSLMYSVVDNSTLKLNDIPADSTFADDRGNLVARFNSTKVKAIVTGEIDVPYEATLNLTGEKKDGTSFTGSDTVRVIDPPGKLTETTHSSKI